MKTQTAAAPRASGRLSPYQQQIKDVLEIVAALQPERDHCVSETAIYVRWAKFCTLKEDREVVRTAMELLQDRGFARRELIHYRFKRPFRTADVEQTISWPGVWHSPIDNTTGNKRS